MAEEHSGRKFERSTLENEILSTAQKIPVRNRNNPDGDCFDQHAIDEFIEAWANLLHYYEEQDDRDINIEVVREYIHGVNKFGGVRYFSDASRRCLEQADDAATEIEG